MWRDWCEQTHSTGFELRRHFFRRFFDSDLVSSPDQWRAVAIGMVAVLLSLAVLSIPGYYRKYLWLGNLPTSRPYQLAMLADILSLILLAMWLVGLLTVIQWHTLFPSLRDYLVLAALPIRMRDLFVAKFTALLAFAVLLTAATTAVPSVLLPALFSGKYAPGTALQGPAIFVSSSLAALFVFFCLVALQGILLNTIPLRSFGTVSLAVQGTLVTGLLCGLPLASSVLTPGVMERPPYWALWLPPVWFLGLDQAMAGSPDARSAPLALIAIGSLVGAAGAAVGTYMWGYKRHRVRLIEAVRQAANPRRPCWRDAAATRMVPNQREMAVLAFTAKTLARSPLQRLVLTAFLAAAAALICDSFANLFLTSSLPDSLSGGSAFREAAVAAPLALSLFILSGLGYLFRLPVELRANWIFRFNEAGNRLPFLAAVERFLLWCAVAPVVLLTLPIEVRLLGIAPGIAGSTLCLFSSLILMEALLMRSNKIPFTSSYLPGRRPVIQTLLIYGVAISLYVSALAAIINNTLNKPVRVAVMFAILLLAWVKIRQVRKGRMLAGNLQFEELPEPAVLTLDLDRD